MQRRITDRVGRGDICACLKDAENDLRVLHFDSSVKGRIPLLVGNVWLSSSLDQHVGVQGVLVRDCAVERGVADLVLLRWIRACFEKERDASGVEQTYCRVQCGVSVSILRGHIGILRNSYIKTFLYT